MLLVKEWEVFFAGYAFIEKKTRQEKLHNGGRASRGKSVRDVRFPFGILLQMLNKKIVDLEITFKITECRDYNDAIWWRILYKRHNYVLLRQLSSFSTRYNHWKCWTINIRQGHGAPHFSGKYGYLQKSSLHIFSRGHTFFEISTFKILTLKCLAEITAYSISNGDVLLTISTFINVNIMHFKFLPWKSRSRSWSVTFVMMPFDGQYMTFYLMTV